MANMSENKQKITEEMESKKFPELDFYLNEQFSDVWFVIEDQRLAANKTLLSLKSHVFRTQFSGDWADSGQKEIVVTDATVEGFKTMLRFFHKEELVLSDDQSLELALDIYNLANKYQLERLMLCLEDHVCNNLIHEDNFVDIYTFAFERKFENLMKISRKFMASNMNGWVDKEFEDLITLNDMTNNSLFEIVLKKFLHMRSHFSQKLSVLGLSEVRKYNNNVLNTWSTTAFLTDVIPYDFNKLSKTLFQ